MNDANLRLGSLKAFLFDVDGVLTDGGLYVDEEGRTSKRFDIRDGAGLAWLQKLGFEVGFISGHDSEAVRRRARDLGVRICYTGVADKRPVWDEILEALGLRPERVFYMGDDLIDVALMKRAGFAATVPDAHDEVKRAADYVTRAPGGRGAVREVVEMFLDHTGRLEELLQRFR